MTRTKEIVAGAKTFPTGGYVWVAAATTLSIVLTATPTTTFSTVPIAPTTPTVSPQTQPTPVPLTAWTKKVEEGQAFDIMASCY